MKNFEEWFYWKHKTHVDVARVIWACGRERVTEAYGEWLVERIDAGRKAIKAKLLADAETVEMYDQLYDSLGG
jgi:hypothetical protein